MRKYIKINDDGKIEILPDGQISNMSIEIFVADITKGSDLDIDKSVIPKQFKGRGISPERNFKNIGNDILVEDFSKFYNRSFNDIIVKGSTEIHKSFNVVTDVDNRAVDTTTSTVTNAKPECYSDNFNTYCLDKDGNYVKQIDVPVTPINTSIINSSISTLKGFDIESLNFEYDDKWEEGHIYYTKDPFNNSLYMLIHNNILHDVTIKKFNITTNKYDIKFDGKCKSIDELKYVLNLIQYDFNN